MNRRFLQVILVVALAPLALDIASSEETASSENESVTQASRMSRDSLLGVDADQDGIRDDLHVFTDVGRIATQAAPAPPQSKVARAFAEALTRRQKDVPAPFRAGCLDYLLLDPEDRSAADRYIQSRTSGAFGTHPCDPSVSPLFERPFDSAIAEVYLGPLRVDYSHLE